MWGPWILVNIHYCIITAHSDYSSGQKKVCIPLDAQRDIQKSQFFFTARCDYHSTIPSTTYRSYHLGPIEWCFKRCININLCIITATLLAVSHFDFQLLIHSENMNCFFKTKTQLILVVNTTAVIVLLKEESLKASQAGITKFLQKFEETGCLTRTPSSGHPSKATAEIKTILHALLRTIHSNDNMVFCTIGNRHFHPGGWRIQLGIMICDVTARVHSSTIFGY